MIDCSGVILCGGLNTRMGGENKAFLEVGGKTILERLVGALSEVFDEILLVTRQPEIYEGLPVKVVSDIFPDRSSLTGIHAGLTHAGSGYAFVVPCDAPFIKPAVIRALLAEADGAADVVVPSFNDHYEPLCAVYSKRCLPFIEAQLAQGDYKIVRFFPEVRLKAVPIEKLRKADQDLLSFFNVNTPEALRTSRNIGRK